MKVLFQKIFKHIYLKICLFFDMLTRCKVSIACKEMLEYKRFEKSFVDEVSSYYVISNESECIYRNQFYNERNRELVDLCKNHDLKRIALWYGEADSDKMYYDEYFEHRMSMRIIAKYIERHIPKNTYILDVACGHGSIDKYLAQSGYKIKGIDLNPNRIKEIRDYISDAECIDIDSINKDSKYGVLISLEMLEHVPDIRKTLSNMYMILEDRGLCFISVPFERMIDDEQHVRFFSKESMVALLQETGFKVKAIVRLAYLNHEKENDLVCVCEK
ncbi:Methyltransferase domain-containing protein [Pseudobutyrivibrio sp. UC1225]|uniref:class I SAM-dependent methyltransferase n=1 Tax=Pseudobutyrivibrio sp. UC1225 TaxID=1798185 RepID=UPI0008E475DA|nr:class I SAM-dependent methyltransferase [Pseudobutyrivibrio sp. UC1225]SFN79067.1 Methyltransferase domain-containing protein [Pseudobutyrivibrio sp. UC1225]